MASGSVPASGQPLGPGRAAWLGVFLTAALIALLAMSEIGRLVGGVSAHGTTHPASALYSVFQIRQAGAALRDWTFASCAGVPIRGWLSWLLVFDVPFIVGYAGLGIGATRRWPIPGIGANPGWLSLAIKRLTLVLVAVDVVEDVLTAVALAGIPSGPGCQGKAYDPGLVVGLLTGATILKTVLALGLALCVLWVIVTKDPGHCAWRRVTAALGLQRFIVIVVAVLAVLLLLSGAAVLEQGVDVERAWVLNGNHWLGGAWAFWGLLFMIGLAGALRYLASVKSAPMAFELQQGKLSASRPPQVTPVSATGWAAAFGQSLCRTWPWLLASGVLAGVILALRFTHAFRVTLPAGLVLPVLLLTVPLASAATARISAEPPTYVDADSVRLLALRIGRALAWYVPVLLLLSVCRAMVGPMMVLGRGDQVLCWVVFTVSAVLAVGYVAAVLWQNPSKLPDPNAGAAGPLYWVQPQLVGARKLDDAAPIPGRLMSVLPAIALTVVCAVPLVLWPVTTSRFISVIGTVGLALLGLTAFYATLQILAQLTDAPHVFQIFRLTRTPVISLMVLVGVVSTLLGAGVPIHGIRAPLRSATDERPALTDALTAWFSAQSPNCVVPAVGTSGVQPLVLVAAEGGGVRAAWWTVDAMTSLTATPCGRSSVLLASGVSGGAIGLAVMASAADPYGAMRRIAGPDALAGAVDGLLSRDLIAGSLGVEIPAADGPPRVPFPDRSALMEHSWEREVPGLGRPFPQVAADRLVPWFTVFSGTSVAHTCRALVADIQLTTATRCDAPGNPTPGAYDLFHSEPCDLGIALSTASLLAARFPYVTPSGVISTCERPPVFADQLIDGGYSENSGIDIVDAALGQVMPAIRAHNQEAIASRAPLVVPMVIFLHNTVVATDGSAPPPRPKPEVLVPPLNLMDSSVLGNPSTLLQRASAVAQEWVPASAVGATASSLRQAFADAVGSQILTVAPEQTPALALPLGWTLSQGTRDALDKALKAYLTCTPEGTRTCDQSKTFNTLLRLWAAASK